MRVWVFGRAIPTKNNNMMGSFEFEQAQMISRNGYEVYYPVFDFRSIRHVRKYGFVLTELNGVNTVTINIPIGKIVPRKLKKRVFSWLKEKLLNCMVKKYGAPDIVHVHYPASFQFKQFNSLKEGGAKLICTEHWTKVQEKKISEEVISNLKNYIDFSDCFICVGELLKKSIEELTRTKRTIEVIPNIVTRDFYYEENSQNKNTFRFVGVGRLVKCKRFDMLINAFADAFRGDYNVKLDIIGGGDEYEFLQELVCKLSIGEQVNLLGTMERKEIANYYHKCDVLVMASNLETFGVPIIEAMASGLPVITTDAMGFPSLFQKEHGYLIPKDNEEEMSIAMKKIYNNYNAFNKKEISAYAIKTFGEKAVFEKLDSIYRGVL